MPTKKLLLLLSILTLFITQVSFACDCDFSGKFLEVAKKTELVALVKVTKYVTFKKDYDKTRPISMEVEIVDIYKGNETRRTITVWGDNGRLCRPYLSQFYVDNYYVIAFDKAYDGLAHENEKSTDYSISICGEYWLMANIKKQIATGPLSEKNVFYYLSTIKEKLSAK